MQRNSMNQDNDRVGSNGYGQMNRGYDNEQHQGDRSDSGRSFGGYQDNRSGTNRSFGGYDDNGWTGSQGGFDQGSRTMSGYRGTDRSMSNYRDENYRGGGSRNDESGYGGSQYSGYRGTDDRSHRSYGTDDRGFSTGTDRHSNDEHERGRWGQDHDRGYRAAGDERHPHDEHERGRWGSDYDNQRGHRYQGGIIDDSDHHRREEAFQRSGYQSHGMYNRSRSGVYQDRDDRGRFNDTGEGRSYGQGYTGGYDRGYRSNSGQGDHGRFGGSDAPARNDFDHRMDRNDRSRFSSDDNRRYGSPSYGYDQHQQYGRGGYGRDDRHRDEQRGMGGSVASDRFGRNDNDSDRRWTGGGYEEDRRGRGRGRY
jgi:hypothetical protein